MSDKKKDYPEDIQRLINPGIPLPDGVVKFRKPESLNKTLEGRDLIEIENAREQAKKFLSEYDQGMTLGGVRVNTETNVFYSGLTRMGKTSAMKMHIAEVLWRIGQGSKEKVTIFNASNEFIPFIYAIVGDDVPVYILNPSDKRCVQWDIGADIEGAANVMDLSNTFAPSKEGDTPFFTEGAGSLIGAVINAFFLSVAKDKKNLEWTLRDVACATRTPERIKQTLGLQPQYLSYISNAFLERANTDVYASLIARTKELSVVAAMWDGRPKLSLKRDFLDSNKGAVLVLGADANNQAITLELNRLILERLAKLIADRDECEEAKYWIFLDEFQKLGKTTMLKELVKEGLKRGIRTHLSCQNKADIVGTYGKEDASVLFSECGSHYIFKQGDEDSAEQARKAIGKRKIVRWNKSAGINFGHQETDSSSLTVGYSYQPGTEKASTINVSATKSHSETNSFGVSANIQEQTLEEPAISTGALQNLGIGEFYCVTPTVSGFWKHRYEWSKIERVVKARSARPEHAKYIRRDDAYYDYLKDWTPDDVQRLFGRKELDSAKGSKPASQAEPEEESYIATIKRKYGSQ